MAGQYGLAINHHEKWTIEQLAESLRANKPVLVSNRVLLASGAPSHYFVVVGIVGDDVFYNDSYTLSETEGKQKRGKLKDLMTAWSTNIDQDKDPTNEAGWNGWGMAVQ